MLRELGIGKINVCYYKASTVSPVNLSWEWGRSSWINLPFCWVLYPVQQWQTDAWASCSDVCAVRTGLLCGLLAMLDLGVDYGKPGGRGGGRAATARQLPVSGRALARESGISIKQKISQWEGLSQHEDAHGGRPKAQGPHVSCTRSGDVRNVIPLDNKTDGLHGKANMSKAKSLGLDFRENQTSHGQYTVGRKSEPEHSRPLLNEHVISTKTSLGLNAGRTQRPVNKSDTSKQKNDNDAIDHVMDDITSLPEGDEDPDDSLPPGNFYTSRGFWRRLEDSPWKREKDLSPVSKHLTSGGTELRPQNPITPPPKPQRTFQYQGANSPPEYSDQRVKTNSIVSQSKQLRKHDVICPPSVSPPPCPVTSSNGISRNRKNRWVNEDTTAGGVYPLFILITIAVFKKKKKVWCVSSKE